MVEKLEDIDAEGVEYAASSERELPATSRDYPVAGSMPGEPRAANGPLDAFSGLINGLQRTTQYAAVAAGAVGLTNGRAWSGPLNAQIGISDPCNHRCVMCWDHPPAERENALTSPKARFGQRKPRLMTLKMFTGVVDDLYELGTRRIELVGRGEPLMNPNALEMLRYTKSLLGTNVQLISNGALVDEKVARAIVECGLDNLKVSLNAGRPATYPRIHVTESEENYLKVKSNLRRVSDLKAEARVQMPSITLSFCIGAFNYGEIEDMIRASHEVGAQEAMFTHTVVHDDTQDLMLTRAQYLALQESTIVAERLADEFGIQNNLATLRNEVPSYLGETAFVGPATVPCYAGWYFAFVLGNGSVMFCCQCSVAIDEITEQRRFRDIWNDHAYRDYRKAARNLPESDPLLKSCECNRCALRRRNLSIHNFARPFERIECGDEVETFSLTSIRQKLKGRKS